MKRIFASIVAISLAGAATAGTLGLQMGASFFDPSAAGAQVDEGESFAVCWNLDSDIAVGMYFERVGLLGAGYVAADTLTVSALQVMKGVVKNVAVGLRMGAGTESSGPTTGALVDIVGQVKILSGTGDKVEGSVVGTIASRHCSPVGAPASVDGLSMGLALLVEF
jgi:hypothetical protein